MRAHSPKGWAIGAAVALGAALVPSTAFAGEGDVTISGDTYREVVFDHAIEAWDGERWYAKCPPRFPYLSADHSENDQQIGYGLHISEETPSALHLAEGYGWLEGGPTWRELENGAAVATGNSGTVSNWSVVRQHLTITMECTRDLAAAWLET